MQKLIAEDGKVYTNGETYGSEICLPDGADSSVWLQIDESLIPADGGAMKYSTLSIKRELAKLGAWTATKQLLETAGYWDDFILANYLSATDEVFRTACAALVSSGIVTQAQLDELLPLCVWTAD